MEEKQVFEAAKIMFLQNRGRKEVLDFLGTNGIENTRSETMATEAFLAIKEQRREMIAEANPDLDEQPIGGGGMASVGIGAFIMIGGIVASASTDRLFYGAILVGLITMIGGFVRR